MIEKQIATEDELEQEVIDIASVDYAAKVVYICRVLAVEDEEPIVHRKSDRIVMQTEKFTVVFNDLDRKEWRIWRNTRGQPVCLHEGEYTDTIGVADIIEERQQSESHFLEYDCMFCENCNLAHPLEIKERQLNYCGFCEEELHGRSTVQLSGAGDRE